VKRSRRNDSPALKGANVALGTIRDDSTLAELGQQYQVRQPRSLRGPRLQPFASRRDTLHGKAGGQNTLLILGIIGLSPPRDVIWLVLLSVRTGKA